MYIPFHNSRNEQRKLKLGRGELSSGKEEEQRLSPSYSQQLLHEAIFCHHTKDAPVPSPRLYDEKFVPAVRSPAPSREQQKSGDVSTQGGRRVKEPWDCSPSPAL